MFPSAERRGLLSMLLASVRRFRVEFLEARAGALDAPDNSEAVREVWGRAHQALGLNAALVTEGRGGAQLDPRAWGGIIAELARGSAGFAALLLSHNLALWALQRAGDDALLERLVAAPTWSALIGPWVEPAADGARAGWVLGGAGAGDFVAVSPGGGACYHARALPSTPGDAIADAAAPMGLRASRAAAVARGDLALQPLLACRWDGAAAGELEARLLLGMAALCSGILGAALEQAWSYARQRYQGGRLIVEHPTVREMLATMAADLRNLEALLAHAATPEPELATCRAAKLAAGRMAVAGASMGMQVLGGYGYMRDYGMERLLRDARASHLFPRPPHRELEALLAAAGYPGEEPNTAAM